jgi:hypothetical protein
MYGSKSAKWPFSDVVGWFEGTKHSWPERLSDPAEEAQDTADLSSGGACDSLSAITQEPEIQQ